MSDNIEIGDVVRLNSSSTRMTVDAVGLEDEEGAIQCIWFDAEADLKTARFHPPQLVIIKKVGAI